LLVIVAILIERNCSYKPPPFGPGVKIVCGRAAKARLTTLVKGGKVNCTAREKDRFGRIVAVCSAEGVPDLGMPWCARVMPSTSAARLAIRTSKPRSRRSGQARHMARNLRQGVRLALAHPRGSE